VREGGALEMRDRKLWTRVHNRVWTATAATVIALGLFGSVAAWGPMPALATFLSAATLGGVCHLSIASLATPDAVAWRHIAVGALVVGALTLALGGLLAISGSGAVWVVVLLGLTCGGFGLRGRAHARRNRTNRHSRTRSRTPDTPPWRSRTGSRMPTSVWPGAAALSRCSARRRWSHDCASS
jgi:hypothetical protein